MCFYVPGLREKEVRSTSVTMSSGDPLCQRQTFWLRHRPPGGFGVFGRHGTCLLRRGLPLAASERVSPLRL